ncbi:hypothetical protein HDU67_001327, partial [Dinochytrium kinnereticum]
MLSSSAAAAAASNSTPQTPSSIVLRKSISVPILRRPSSHATLTTDTKTSSSITINSSTTHALHDPSDALDRISLLHSRLTADTDPIVPVDLSQPDREEALAFCDHACLRRYLRATRWDADKAAAKLRETVRWRVEYRPHELKNSDLRGESKGGNNYINGFDKEGRPIIYIKKRGKAEDPYKNVQLLVLIIEYAIKIMPE